MLRSLALALPLALASLGSGTEARASSEPLGPVEVAEGVTLDPILNIRFRLEDVDQEGFAENATAPTLRARAGVSVSSGGFTVIAEGEATRGLSNDYNDTLPGNGIEPFPVVADPDSTELNRLSIGYKGEGFGVTLGRQRIIHGDARFLGNVGWRQNEQTFDAVRATAKTGPVSLDVSYANSQRTIFGSKSPNSSFDGDLVLARAEVDAKPVKLAAYTYVIDYDDRVAFSSETYGASAQVSQDVGKFKLSARARLAVQSDTGDNPVSYRATYHQLEGSAKVGPLTFKAGREVLGSDDGVAAFQTPLATAHAFNGWADLFLVTPAAGLRDHYVAANVAIKSPVIKGLSAGVVVHEFDSDEGGVDYGSEVDAVVKFKLGKVGILAKYANYRADNFGRDTERFWLQASISF